MSASSSSPSLTLAKEAKLNNMSIGIMIMMENEEIICQTLMEILLDREK
jgi:hypothetical protein